MFSLIFITSIVVTSALESRVFNGNDLRPEVHGYLVELKLQIASHSGLCSGSILSTKWILSSAHCFPHYIEFITVRQKTSKGDRTLGTVKPLNIIKHAAYIEDDLSVENRQHDIAVIKTSKPIRFDEFTWSIELAKLQPKIGQSAIIAGYGDSELRQLLPREGAVEVSKCPFYVDDLVCSVHKIRAGGGDSGGALTSRGRLVGVTSASCTGAYDKEVEECITVYTSVAAHLKWILAQIS